MLLKLMSCNYVNEDNMLVFSASEMLMLFKFQGNEIDLRITGITVALINGWAYYIHGSKILGFAWPITFQMFKEMGVRECEVTRI